MNFTGIGELTAMSNWREAIEPFMALPKMVKSLTTNMQKQMDDDEIATLAKFQQISVSIDTADAKLLREIRVKSELRNITTNIAKVRAYCIKIGKPYPSFRFNVVVTNRSALTLLDTSAFAIACGMDGMMLIELNDTDFHIDQKVVRHVSHLTDNEFSEFAYQVEASRKLMAEHRKEFIVTGDLNSYIQSRLKTKNSDCNITPGQTRMCGQLWSYAVIKEDGRISHCCANMMSQKSLREHSFAEIMDDDEIRSWRLSLLNGKNLPHSCINCHWAGTGSPQDLLQLIGNETISAHKLGYLRTVHSKIGGGQPVGPSTIKPAATTASA